MQTFSPVDLLPLPCVPDSSASEVLVKVRNARLAQPLWAQMTFDERAKCLKLAGKAMLIRRQEVMQLIHEEAGKTPSEMLLSEVVGPLQYIKDWIKVARPWLKPRKLAINPLAFPKKKGVIEMLPRGVVGVIAPWNYPLGNFFKPVFAALLCGNSVVVKPSEYAPRTGEWFVSVLNEFLPQGVLSIVQGDRSGGIALIEAGIDAVTFTGSSASGVAVAQLAAQKLIPCSVELGGKDAAIVLSDCNLDRTVAGIMHWGLHNAGQACGDIERVFVEESIADLFIEKLVSAVRKLRTQSGEGEAAKALDQVDVGPAVTPAQLQLISDHVAEAVAQGAKILCGGKKVGRGLWFEPTVLDYCTPRMRIMQEPTFGPVIPLCRVKDAEEALNLANQNDYGLNGSVWSEDESRAIQIAARLNVGTAFVNNHAFTGALPSAPWTGVKKSGYGIANSEFALAHYTRPRTLVVDRKKTADGWWLPMNSMAEEMGHCLAEAQLGNLGAAIKIPFLMFRREKTALEFVQQQKKTSEHPQVKGAFHQAKFSWSNFFLKGLEKLHPSLFDFELEWGFAAVNAIFAGADRALKAQPKEEAKKFFQDFYQSMPFPAFLSIRLAFWAAGLAPFLIHKKWRRFERLPLEERIALMDAFSKSDSYVLRQMILVLKMNGSFFYSSTTRFHQVTAYEH